MTQPPAYLQDLAVGQLVFHWKFGHGQVLTTRRVDGQEHAQIDFDGHGVVNLQVGLAQLADPSASAAKRRRAPWEALLDESAPLRPIGEEPWRAWFGGTVVREWTTSPDTAEDIGTDFRRYPVKRMWATELGWPEVSVLIHAEPEAGSATVRSGVVLLITPWGTRPTG